ncbi:MAG: hypothetical protein WC091_18025 [Sulfuricellaceae bacterium]
MSHENMQERVVIINVPDDLSPLKFKSFLRSEATDIQARSSSNSFVIIRLFLPERIIFALTQRKLDVLLKDIVDKHPNIYRIVLVTVPQALNFEQMQVVMQDAQSTLAALAKNAKRLSRQQDGSFRQDASSA